MEGIVPESRCDLCDDGYRAVFTDKPPYARVHVLGGHMYKVSVPCANFDEECRWLGEPYVTVIFAFFPIRTRNGKIRWWKWLERHSDLSYTLARGRDNNTDPGY